jgi:beta-lactamase regulating signal transducer with metallopeptidase domain
MNDLALMLHPTDLAWLRWVAGATVSTRILLAAAFALDVVLRRRVEARWRVLLPAVVLLRLALPLQWTSPLGVFGLRAVVTRSDVVATSGVDSPPIEVATSPVAASSAPRAGLPPIAPMLHVGVALALLGIALASRRRASSALRGARPARESVARLAAGVPVVEHDVLGPAVVGLFRPRIVMPSPLVESLAEEEVASVLRHEVAHVRRRDPVVRALVQVATFAAWPVLPAWLAAWWLRGLVEQACDERALEGGGAQARGVHARALVDVATWRPRPLRLALGLLPFGEGVRARVKALRFSRRWATPAQVACVVVLAPMLVLTLGARAAAPEAPGTSSESAEVPAGSTATRVPPLLQVRVEAYRASGVDAPDGPMGEAEAETLRARLMTSGARIDDSVASVLLGDHATTRITDESEGEREALFPTLAATTEDGRLIITVTTLEEPSRASSPTRWIVEPSQALHLTRLAGSPRGAVHVILTPKDVTFLADGAPRIDSPRVSLELADVPLDDAAVRLADLVGTGILVDRQLAARKVSLALVDMPWEEAVDLLVVAAGVDWEPAHGLVKLVPRLDGARIDSRSTPPLDNELAARIEQAMTLEGISDVRVSATPEDILVNGRASGRDAFAASLSDVGRSFGVKDVFVLTPERDGSFEFGFHLRAPVLVQASLMVVRFERSATLEPLRVGATVAAIDVGAAHDARVVMLVPAPGLSDAPFETTIARLEEAGDAHAIARPSVVAQIGQSFGITTTNGGATAKIDLTVHGSPAALTSDVVLALSWIPGGPITAHLPVAAALLEIAEPEGGVTLVAIRLLPVSDAP